MKRYYRSRGFSRADRPPVRFSLILLLVFVMLMSAAAVWFKFHPQDWAVLSERIWPVKPVVKYMQVEVNGREMVLKPGETMHLHPNDSLARISFSSNRPFNYKLRFYSKELDVYALEEPVTISEVLPGEDFAKPREIVVQVKEGPEVLADFIFLVRVTAFDMEAQADRATDINKAIALYRKALSLDPDNEDINKKLVVLLEQIGDYRTAADMYEQMIRGKPDADILKKLLSVYQTSMNYRKLVSTYHRLIKVSTKPEARLYLYRLAQLQVDLRQYDEAIATFETLKAKLPEDQRADILKKLGYLYAQTQKSKKAVKAYEEAAQIDTADPNVFYNLARLYQNQGDIAGYHSSLARALKANPADLKTRLKLAKSYAAAGELEKAEDEFRRLLAADSNHIEARLDLIKVLEKSGQVGPQIEEYEFLLAKDPKDKVVRYNLGVLYFEVGKLDQSMKHMEELVRLNSRDHEARQYLFEIYRRQKKEKEAYRLAKELTRLAPEFEPSYDYIFDYLDRREYYQDLAGQARQWIKMRPQVVKFREYLAYAHIKQNKLNSAVQDYEAILKLTPKDTDVMFKMAKIYEAVGRMADAIKMYDRVLKIKPGHEQAAQARLRLSLERLKVRQKE
ncbi:MAG: tetratricopeptide repeat protein [Deltaproteobacteria bacterium]|nr:tetratricopeptide repeat protein [Deltaproteobacteria bacterium]